MTELDDAIRDRVAHLYGKTLSDLLSDRIEVPPEPPCEPVPGVEARPAVVVGPHGDIPVRVYAREGAAACQRALVWCHGGAWMRGDLDMPEADGVARRAAAALSAVVVSVDYRLAPAHTHPVPVDDVVAVFEAVTKGKVAEVGEIDPTRVGLGGASAGGHLSACASLELTARGEISPRALFLAYPATDPIHGPWPDEPRPEVCPDLLWFDERLTPGLFQIYLGGAPPDAKSIPSSGALEGLPPTLVTTAALDALGPQAKQFAKLVNAAGVRAEVHTVAGVLHGYLNQIGSGIPIVDAALDRHLAWVDEHI